MHRFRRWNPVTTERGEESEEEEEESIVYRDLAKDSEAERVPTGSHGYGASRRRPGAAPGFPAAQIPGGSQTPFNDTGTQRGLIRPAAAAWPSALHGGAGGEDSPRQPAREHTVASASRLWESVLSGYESAAPSPQASQAPAPAPGIPTAAELRAQMMSARKEASRQPRQQHSTPVTGPSRLHRGSTAGGASTGTRSTKKPRFAILDAHSAEASPEVGRAAAAGRRLLGAAPRGTAGALAPPLRTPVQHRLQVPLEEEEEDVIEDMTEDLLDAASDREESAFEAGWANPDDTVTPQPSSRRNAVLSRPAATPSMSSARPHQQRRQMVSGSGLAARLQRTLMQHGKQVSGAGPSAAPALVVTVLEVARESRHVIKTRCSCQPPGSEIFVMFSSKSSGDVDTAAGSRLTLHSWRTVEVPGVQMPVLLCFNVTGDTGEAPKELSLRRCLR